MRLTDAQVEALTRTENHATNDLDMRDGDGEYFDETHVIALALEVQDFRALRSVMDTALKDVSARLITPYDALARIVMELASLDSVGTTDGR